MNHETQVTLAQRTWVTSQKKAPHRARAAGNVTCIRRARKTQLPRRAMNAIFSNRLTSCSFLSSAP